MKKYSKNYLSFFIFLLGLICLALIGKSFINDYNSVTKEAELVHRLYQNDFTDALVLNNKESLQILLDRAKKEGGFDSVEYVKEAKSCSVTCSKYYVNEADPLIGSIQYRYYSKITASTLLTIILILIFLFVMRKLFINFKMIMISISKGRVLAEKERVSRQVAHDIRSPLIALQTYLKNGHNNEDVALKALSRIESIASKLGNKKFNTQKTVFSLFTALSDLVSEYEIYSPNEIKIVSDEVSKSLNINANSTEFKAAISNIINNSLEAKEDAKIKITLLNKDDQIEMSISDNGPGIKNPESVFNEGFTTKEEGSGLGLYQVKSFTDSLGGNIRVNSNERGTVFTLALPVYLARPILILDDDKLYLKTSELRLKALGSQYHMFTNKESLYRFLDQNPETKFDLYLDQNLQTENDGLEVKEDLKENVNINVILNSSYSSKGKESWY